MRAAALILMVLFCTLGALLLVQVRWSAPAQEGLLPLERPSSRSGEGGLNPGGAGLQGGAAEDDEPLRMTAGRLPGRCVRYLGDDGVPGVTLSFFEGDEPLATAQSDENGEFLVELGRQAVSRVEAIAPPGLWIVDQGLERERYLVRLAPLDIGPLRARLVDRVTREAVPEYVVQVRGEEGWSEVVKTNGEGVFQTEVLLARGWVTLSSTAAEVSEFVAGRTIAGHDHQPNGTRPPLAVVAIPVGPTYRLLLDKPESLSTKRLRAFLIPVYWLEEVLDDTEISAEVRPGKPPWVRFAFEESWIEDARLVVTDANGHWRGVAKVDPGPGIHLDPVPIRLERMARVAAQVVDAEGAGVARANVTLQSTEADRASVPRLSRSNGVGNFVFEGVPPGTYAVSIRHPIQGACEAMIHIQPEDGARHRFQLEPYVVAGDVSGVVRSRTGTFQDLVSLRLDFEREDEEEYVPSRYVRVTWTEEAGQYVGRFQFLAVAEGKCLLRAGLRGLPHEVTPLQVEFEAPMSDLEFFVEDDREVWRLGLHVVDNADGRWISEARLRVMDGAGGVLYDGRPPGWTPKKMFAEDEVLLWEVRAPGYVTVRGDRAAFDLYGGANRRMAIVRLRQD